MAAHLKAQGAFGVRMGPPVVTRRWDAATVKDGIADPAVRRLGDLPPTERSAAGARVVSQLTELGWRPQAVEGGFAAGADVYDLRGITETLDADDPHVGLIQFKVGTGGEAVEYAGEWDLPVNRALYKAFQVYLSRR
jgi:vancomycin resistance protein VanK